MGTAGYGDNLTGNRFECVIDTLPFPSYALFMQVELTPEQASFIALGIQEGRFRDSERLYYYIGARRRRCSFTGRCLLRRIAPGEQQGQQAREHSQRSAQSWCPHRKSAH